MASTVIIMFSVTMNRTGNSLMKMLLLLQLRLILQPEENPNGIEECWSRTSGCR